MLSLLGPGVIASILRGSPIQFSELLLFCGPLKGAVDVNAFWILDTNLNVLPYETVRLQSIAIDVKGAGSTK